jgi:hypothetical protein
LGIVTSVFLAQWGRLLHEPGNATLLREARSALGDHVLVLDEASMVSNEDKAKLVRLANLAEVQRLVLVGDKRQLAAVDAGKPFDLVQQAGIERANMDVNLRGRDPILRRAQAAAQEGRIDDALQALAPSTIEARGDSAIVAAEKWLSLSPADRDRTSIYASGRALRSAVNEAVQCGLKANGELGPRSGRLVTVTRLRDGLTLIADNAEKLGRAIKSNSGEKASALEVTQRLKAAAAKGLSQDEDVRSPSPASDKPELTKERVKHFEIGI